MTNMTISRAAKRAGVGVETIRFYERKGLIEQPLKPKDGGFRVYPQETVEQLRFIRSAQSLGFSLGEIGELLSLSADPDTHCCAVRDRAKAKLADVEYKLTQLQSIQQALKSLIEACPGKGKALRHCSILAMLDTGPLVDRHSR